MYAVQYPGPHLDVVPPRTDRSRRCRFAVIAGGFLAAVVHELLFTAPRFHTALVRFQNQMVEPGAPPTVVKLEYPIPVRSRAPYCYTMRAARRFAAH